jgi:hypothetical protein
MSGPSPKGECPIIKRLGGNENIHCTLLLWCRTKPPVSLIEDVLVGFADWIILLSEKASPLKSFQQKRSLSNAYKHFQNWLQSNPVLDQERRRSVFSRWFLLGLYQNPFGSFFYRFRSSYFSKFTDRIATLRGVLDSSVKSSSNWRRKILFGFLDNYCVERFRILLKITPSFPLLIQAL